MRNIKYKAISKDLEALAKPSVTPGRVSIGFEQNIGEYFYINIADLVPYHKQARRVFDEKTLLALADTIREHGIRQPLTVLSQPGNTGKYEIISGERRYKAAQLAGLEKVPCIIIHDPKAAAEIALVENIQRENLHAIELGEAILGLLSTGDYLSQRVLAKKLGLPRTTIVESIRLAGLDTVVKESLLINKIVNREFLRSILKEDDVEKQKTMLFKYVNNMKKQDSSRIHKKKTIIAVTLEGGELKINLKGLTLLTKDQKQFIKSQFDPEW